MRVVQYLMHYPSNVNVKIKEVGGGELYNGILAKLNDPKILNASFFSCNVERLEDDDIRSIEIQVPSEELQKSDNDEEVLENIAFEINPETLLDAKTRQKIILKAVNSLPKKMRDVVIFCEFEEYSIKQTALKLRISEGTVKSRLFNARKILANVLKPLQGE